MNRPASETQDPALEEMVEPLNRYFHVPVAGRVVDGLKHTPLTPNQVTGISVLFGLAAAWAFSRGTVSGMIGGGALLEISLILDCVDGQLARAKNMASDLGRVIDGVGGYVANLAVVAGIAWGYPQTRLALAVLTVLTILRAIAYDHCKQVMTTRVWQGYDWARAEWEKVARQMEVRPSLLLRLYRLYLTVQRAAFQSPGAAGEKDACWDAAQRARFYEINRPVLRLWRWNGPDLVFFMIALSALGGVLETALIAITLLVGVQFVVMFGLHRSRIRYETNS